MLILQGRRAVPSGSVDLHHQGQPQRRLHEIPGPLVGVERGAQGGTVGALRPQVGAHLLTVQRLDLDRVPHVEPLGQRAVIPGAAGDRQR
jgi:hypothetical protein